MWICLNSLPFGPLHPCLLIQHICIYRLTNGWNNSITVNGELGIGDGKRATAAPGIGFTQAGALKLNAGGTIVFGNNAGWTDVELKIGAFGNTIFALFRGCAVS